MIFSELEALFWVEKIIAIAVIFQTAELLQIRETTREDGIWAWSVLGKEFSIFPAIFQRVLELTLKYPNFIFLLSLRFFCAGLLLWVPHPVAIFVLLLSTVLIALRWRGTFNGGSDYMTIIILAALCIARIFRDNFWVTFGCLWYITLQVCASYFVAGVVKLKKENWRTGTALRAFLGSTIYEPHPLLTAFARNASLVCFCSWLIMVFEVGFPLALFNSSSCIVFVCLAFFFHLANCFVFGLNRFLFAWTAAYPALVYCSQIQFV